MVLNYHFHDLQWRYENSKISTFQGKLDYKNTNESCSGQFLKADFIGACKKFNFTKVNLSTKGSQGFCFFVASPVFKVQSFEEQSIAQDQD